MIYSMLSKQMLSFIFFCFLTFYALAAFSQTASIQEQSRTIKTYPYSDPNPIPSLAINNKVSRFYPYFMFDGYTNQSTKQKWKVITLENPFIKVLALPEVGGKVWGAIEKSTGKEFVYLNQVLKFRAIGIRGPWTSGGIEHNFGLDLGHAPWTASPVDYIIKKNSDGSVSCIVGGLDLASRTQWRVDIRLPKDKAYFETRSMWYNPTPLHNSYLSWENAAFKATSDLQFYFPGNYYIGHDGSAHPWPTSDTGRNLALYSENDFGGNKSYHVMGSYKDWFGGYWHNLDFGFAHWALYSDTPGKKIWIWSLAREGAIWEDLLTDTDGQYIEAQAGIKFNQAGHTSGSHSPFDQLSLRPDYLDTKRELWFPVKSTNGIASASPYGTLNVNASKSSLTISLSPNVTINDSLIIIEGNQIIYSEKLHLKPMQIYHKTINFPNNEVGNFVINIGKDKLTYSSDPTTKRISRPVKTRIKQSFTSTERLFRLAEDKYKMKKYDEALSDYLSLLKDEPAHSRALIRVAELYYRRAQYAKGLQYARKVLEIDTYNPGANYIYGIIQREMGQLVKAAEALSIAALSQNFRSGAYTRIAAINLQNKNYKRAVTYAKKALNFNRKNLSAHHFLGTSYRKLKRPQKAKNTFERLLEIDPLNHYAKFEMYLLDSTTNNLADFKSRINNELPYETYLELGLKYANHGLYTEAIQVLKQSPPYPVVYYWLAYLERNYSIKKSRQYLKQAEKMSPSFVFPFRLETIPVLTWAQKQHKSWKTAYYLGLIYWSKSRTKIAKQLFKQLGNVSDYAPFYISRGVLFSKTGSPESDYIENNFKQAIELNPKQWRTWHYLSNYFQNTGALQKQLDNTHKAYNRFPENAVIGLDYAKSLLNSHKFSECLKVLEEVQILPQEGAREGHDIYEMANLSLAVNMVEQKKYQQAIEYLNESRKWPEHLGAGKPYEPDTRLQDFIAAYCEIELGKKERANHYYQKIKDYTLEHWGSTRIATNNYIGSTVLRQLGKHQIANQIMKNWKAQQDSLRSWRISQGSASPIIQWVFAKYHNNEHDRKKIEQSILTSGAGTRFRLLLKSIKLIRREGS